MRITFQPNSITLVDQTHILNDPLAYLQSMIKINLLILTLAFLSCPHAEDQGDWIDPFDLVPILVHPFYAGYLEISQDTSFYYMYFPSQNNPGKDPLLVRISSGPACSSLYSALYSKGPFIFTENTENFRLNPHNWNKEANVLFIEAPGGVGFAKGGSENMSDTKFTLENWKALFAFYEKFPELKNQDMYLTGEQYAGITIPKLAEAIIEWNSRPDTPTWEKINLKGFLLQNPCILGNECDARFQFSHYQMAYLERHYFISIEKYQEYEAKCTFMTEECEQIRRQIENSFHKTNSDLRNIYKSCQKKTAPIYEQCLDTVGIYKFFQSPQTKEIMHIDSDAHWQLCNLTIMENYERDPLGSYHNLEKLLKEDTTGLRVWIISGSLSGSVPVVGTRKWLEDLKVDLGIPVTRPWESWKYDEDINAGEVQEMGKITFATVRSAGLHIYNDQPEIGYHIIESFLKKRSL